MSCDIHEAKRRVGLPRDFRLRLQADYDHARELVKEQIIAARRAGDDMLAAHLSEAKATFKRRFGSGHLCRCGEAKSPSAVECRMCAYHRKRHGKDLPVNTVKEYEVSLTDLMPVHRTIPTELTKALEALKNGLIGSSFATSRGGSTIKHCAKRLGIQVLVRNISNDPKKPLNKVWRTDGKSVSEVNAIIAERLNK